MRFQNCFNPEYRESLETVFCRLKRLTWYGENSVI